MICESIVYRVFKPFFKPNLIYKCLWYFKHHYNKVKKMDHQEISQEEPQVLSEYDIEKAIDKEEKAKFCRINLYEPNCKEYLDTKLIFLLNDGIYTPFKPNFIANLILFEI